MEGFWRIHSGLGREGPGSTASTLRALSLAMDLPADPVVLDVGCGPGASTVALASALPAARIIAVDLHPPFVDAVAEAARVAGVGDRVTPVQGDMGALGPVLAAAGIDVVDLLWCEGAAYIIGFEQALAAWAPLVRPGGHLALTEPVWTAPTVSRAVRDFWEVAYPAMQPPGVRRAQIRNAPGWDRIGDFTLPASDWAAYYDPIRVRVADLRPDSAEDPSLAEAITATEEEVAVFDGGGSTMVGYQFFVLRRT
jgi:SAM-dependent methyltransferase